MLLNKKIWLSFLFGWCCLYSSLFFCIRIWALNPNFYIALYDQTNLAEDLSVSKEDLNQSITILLDYLKDHRTNINNQMKMDGKVQEVFDAKEKRHMVDVKALYQKAKTVSYITLAFAIGIGIYIRKGKYATAFLTKGFLQAAFCFFVFLAFLALWMITDFTDFWTHFHLLFFSNQDWLLTPGIDFMIDMLPEFVFSTLVFSIVISYALLLFICIAYCIYYQKKKAPIAYEVDL